MDYMTTSIENAPTDYSKAQCENLRNYVGKEKLIFPKFSGDIGNYKAMLTFERDGKVVKGVVRDLILAVEDDTKTVIKGIVEYPGQNIVKVLIFTKDNWNSVEAIFFGNPQKTNQFPTKRFKPEKYIQPYSHRYS